jgi:hypothetical protein
MQEIDKKKYMRVVSEGNEEFKLIYGDRVYYLKKKDLKWK